MDFICKKTTELDEKELKDISELFSIVFPDHPSRSPEYLLNQYTQNAFGTSFHTMMYEDDVLVGHNAGVPGYLRVNGKKMSALNNVDLMIKEEKRGLQGFMFLMKKAWAFYKQNGIQLIYSIPNNNSHPLLVKMKFVKDISPLYTYCLPYRIGGVKKGLSFANLLSELFCFVWVSFASLFASKKEHVFGVQRDYESFEEKRYKRSDRNYSFATIGDVSIVYKVIEHEGVRTAFLIDVKNKSGRALCKAVKYLLKKERKNFDLLLYVGYLPFAYNGLIRIPHRFEPKNFNFVGAVLNNEGLSEADLADYMVLSNWDINLADDDII